VRLLQRHIVAMPRNRCLEDLPKKIVVQTGVVVAFSSNVDWKATAIHCKLIPDDPVTT